MPEFKLTIDNHLCWGCKTCEVACKAENKADSGVKLIWVEEIGTGLDGGKPDLTYQVNRCRHCDDPPCVEACPEGAIAKREDWIVIMDYNLCSGCQACMDSCPHDAIGFDENKVIAQKCNLCYHRVDQGLIPACADNICPAHCIHFEF